MAVKDIPTLPGYGGVVHKVALLCQVKILCNPYSYRYRENMGPSSVLSPTILSSSKPALAFKKM